MIRAFLLDLFSCVTVMSILGFNLILFCHMTSRAQGAALSTLRPNLFVNFSAPHQKILKVSVKLASETGMVTQRHEPLALLPNYNTGTRSFTLNNQPEDSAAEVTDPENIRFSDRSAHDQPKPEKLVAEFSSAEQIDANANSNEDDPVIVIKAKFSKEVSEEMDGKSGETMNFWIPGSEETGENANNGTVPLSIQFHTNHTSNHNNDFPDYSENDSENSADTDDDQTRYFVKVKAKAQPRDAFVGLGLSSAPISQSIEPHILITADDAKLPLPLTFKLAKPSPLLTSAENLENINQTEDKLAPVPNFININSRDVPEIGHENAAPGSPASIIASVTQNYGSTDSTSIPGMAGIDYPILGEVPVTGFDCEKQRYKGFFADPDTKCQAWHYCDFTDGHSTFLCPNGTLFSQVLLTCDWWFNVDCRQAQQLYVLNERLYRYIKAPKPSFPEDYHGPQVDHWLIEQLNLGLLPKMKKIVKDKMVIQQSN